MEVKAILNDSVKNIKQSIKDLLKEKAVKMPIRGVFCYWGDG